MKKCQICYVPLDKESSSNTKNCKEHRGLMKKKHKIEEGILYRRCSRCGDWKIPQDFYKKSYTIRGSSWCKDCFNNGIYLYQKDRALTRKLDLIKQAGGACNVCGYKKNLAALVFHHKDPSKKDFALDARTIGNGSLEIINNEFKKCILMCHNCHSEYHNPSLDGLL